MSWLRDNELKEATDWMSSLKLRSVRCYLDVSDDCAGVHTVSRCQIADLTCLSKVNKAPMVVELCEQMNSDYEYEVKYCL